MTTEPVRAGPDWLALREPADAEARSTELVDDPAAHLPTDGLVVHDLGCGTGSMARWLAPRLVGPQRWVLHDRDAELLARRGHARAPARRRSASRSRPASGDITRLDRRATSPAPPWSPPRPSSTCSPPTSSTVSSPLCAGARLPGARHPQRRGPRRARPAPTRSTSG